MRKNIVLAGFMGTGKSAVSAELSRLTGYKAVDLDAMIEKHAGMSISKIFELHGEPYFRDLETDQIRSVALGSNQVISTGGGAVLRAENMSLLKATGIIFCLTATPETILERTSHSNDRPLLNVPNPLAVIVDMLTAREPFYLKSDVMVETDGRTPLEIAEEIVSTYKECKK